MSTAAPLPVRCSKTDTYAAEVEEIFAGRGAMRLGEMKTAIMTVLATSSRTADRQLAIYRQLGLIRRDVANLWVMATSDAPPLSPVSPMPIYGNGDGETTPMTASPPSPTPYIDGVGDGGDGRGEDRHIQTPNDDHTATTGRTPPPGIVTRGVGCGASWRPADPGIYAYVIARHAAEAADDKAPSALDPVPIPNTPFFTQCSPEAKELRIQWYLKQLARLKTLRARVPGI